MCHNSSAVMFCSHQHFTTKKTPRILLLQPSAFFFVRLFCYSPFALSSEDLAPTRGFEPPTCRLGGGRSILLSYVGLFLLCLYILASGQGNVKHFFARRL